MPVDPYKTFARPAGLEPATHGLEGRRDEPARDGAKRFPLILRPVSRVGGNCFPPRTVTACHTCVTPQPFAPATSRRDCSEVAMFDFDPRDYDSRDDERQADTSSRGGRSGSS